MFTGIITHIGKVEEIISSNKNDLLLKISIKQKINRKIAIGCSIAINGICLTLIGKEKIGKKNIFSFEASNETCFKTTLRNWKKNQELNVEFALRVGDELSGHMVLGHVDTTTKVKNIRSVKDSKEFTFAAKKSLLQFIAKKGSIALDGVSLTVNEVRKNSFSVNLIPHTIANTTFKHATSGSLVNLEIDPLARYCKNDFSHN